jgi:hypothetical protein
MTKRKIGLDPFTDCRLPWHAGGFNEGRQWRLRMRNLLARFLFDSGLILPAHGCRSIRWGRVGPANSLDLI